MTCGGASGMIIEEEWAQVNGYADLNGNHQLLGSTPNGTSYDVTPGLNSFGIAKLWHDNEPTTANGYHYLCDTVNTGLPGCQFGFCYTDFLNNPNELETGDSVVALAFGRSYGPDPWSTGFTGECGDMDLEALRDEGTFSIWIR